MTADNTFRGSNGAAYTMQPDGTCVRVDDGDSPLAHLDLGRQIAARCAIIDGAPLERIRDARVREAVRAIRAGAPGAFGILKDTPAIDRPSPRGARPAVD
jgi:hypothetical protein